MRGYYMTRDPTCSSARLSLQNYYGLLSGFGSKPSEEHTAQHVP